MAPSKRKSQKSSQSVDYSQKPALSEVMCPICMEILVEPVTMPCSHELCMPCFQENVQNGEANFVCPMCRLRISSWARRNARENTLVNTERWAQIRRFYSEKCDRRLRQEENGAADDLSDEDVPITNFPVVSEPGELRREYEEQMKKFEEQRRKEEEAALKASMEYIQRMQEEEEQRRMDQQERVRRDEEMARQLSQSASPAVQARRDSGSDVLIVTPTNPSSRPASKQSNGSGNIRNFLTPRSNSKTSEEFASEPEKYITPPPSCCRKGFHGNGNNPGNENGQPGNKNSQPGNENQPGSSKKSSPYLETGNKQDRCSTGSVEVCNSSPNTSGHNSSHHSDKENREDASPRPGSFTVAPRVNRSSSGSLKELLPVANVSRSASVESKDSITEELNHFKPIHSSPRTPPKKDADGRPLSPVIVRSTPRNLTSAEFGSDTSYELEGSSRVLQRWLRVMEERNAAQETQTKSRATCTAEAGSKRRGKHRARTGKRGPASALQESVGNSAQPGPMKPTSAFQDRVGGLSQSGHTKATQFEVSDTLDSDSDSTDIEKESPRKRVKATEVVLKRVQNVHSNGDAKEGGPLQAKGVPSKGTDRRKQAKPQKKVNLSKTIDSYFEASPPQPTTERQGESEVPHGNGTVEKCTQEDSDNESVASSTHGNTRKRKAPSRCRGKRKGAGNSQQRTEENGTGRTQDGNSTEPSSAKASGKRTCKTKHTEPAKTHFLLKNSTNSNNVSNGQNGHSQAPAEDDYGANRHRHTPEEDDYLLALRLQKQFDQEAKRREEPNRRKGTIDQYMLRAGKQRTQSAAN